LSASLDSTAWDFAIVYVLDLVVAHGARLNFCPVHVGG
jgi:hypothetical protein